MNKVVTYKLRKNDDTNLCLRIEITYDAILKMKKQPFWKKSKNTNLQELSWSDYCKNMSKEYNSYALSESNLAKMEDLCREFIDENGKPVSYTYSSLIGDGHTVNNSSTYSNICEPTVPDYKYCINGTYGYEYTTLPYTCLTAHTTSSMPKYEVGETIRYINTKESGTLDGRWALEQDEEFIIRQNNYKTKEGIIYYELECVKTCPGYSKRSGIFGLREIVENPGYFVFISSPTNPMGTHMSLLEKARNFILGEPEKTFRKVGIQDNCGNFTSDAKAAFMENLMKEDSKKEDGYLQTLAKKLKAEQEEEEKNCCK